MLATIDNRLRRHRRKVLWALALFAAVTVGLTARAALMTAHGHGDMGDAAALCVTAGACVALAGVAVFALRRVVQRRLWLIPAPLAPALALVPVAPGFLIRAGPPPLSQVLRL